MFDRFHRGTNVVGHFPGTGLGLASAHVLVELHGGPRAATRLLQAHFHAPGSLAGTSCERAVQETLDGHALSP